MKMLLKITMLALLLGGADLARAVEPTQTGSVLLLLREGVAPAKPGDQFTSDLELELTLRDGKFDPRVWGYSLSFNKAFHDGEIVKAEGDRLTIRLTLQRDRWSSPKPPGTAQYEIALQRQGDQYTGTFTGRLDLTGGDEPVGREVKGRVTGSIGALWSEPRPGFEKLAPNEHPRLIFRKRDLPVIKQRLATPEGKAIMERFLEQLPKSHAKSPKVQMYLPAGYGLAWQLTGDKTHADKAKESLTGMLDLEGRQDIHYGPMAQAMAVTLDFCYDAWDAEFRQRVIDNLAKRLADLHAANMGGVSLNPHHNHEAIRVAGTGLAALCLLGEKTSDGKEVPDLDRILAIAARATRRYFLYNGTSGSGWGLEGDFYKRMTWNSGPGHVVQAWRSALGTDLLADGLGAWSILGEWMWLPPGDGVAPSEGVRSGQDSGMFILGLTTVPDSMKSGARWLFDRSYGLQGDKTFNMLWAYHAAYLLMNYPFDVPAKPPTESLPWVAPDRTGGHWVFRKPWQGAQDTLVVLNPRFDNPGGTHWITGRSWDMQLFALGKLWIGDRKMEENTGAPGAALPTTGNPQAFADDLSARLTDWQSTPAGTATLSFDMSPIYMRPLAGGEAAPSGQKLVRMSRGGPFVDLGIRGQRSVTLDLSGASGAPVLMVFADKFNFATGLMWNLKLASEAGEAKVAGNVVTVGDPAGANMRVTFLGDKPLTLTPAIQATGSDEYLVVITVQNGPAPAVKVAGDTVTVGGQTIRVAAATLPASGIIPDVMPSLTIQKQSSQWMGAGSDPRPRMLVVGGMHVANDGRWPALLAQTERGWHVSVLGKPETTLAELALGLGSALDKERPFDRVVLQVGNNESLGKNAVNFDDSAVSKHLSQMLKTLREKPATAKSQLVVMTPFVMRNAWIPTELQGRFGQPEERCRSIAATIRSVAKENGVGMVDAYAWSDGAITGTCEQLAANGIVWPEGVRWEPQGYAKAAIWLAEQFAQLPETNPEWSRRIRDGVTLDTILGKTGGGEPAVGAPLVLSTQMPPQPIVAHASSGGRLWDVPPDLLKGEVASFLATTATGGCAIAGSHKTEVPIRPALKVRCKDGVALVLVAGISGALPEDAETGGFPKHPGSDAIQPGYAAIGEDWPDSGVPRMDTWMNSMGARWRPMVSAAAGHRRGVLLVFPLDGLMGREIVSAELQLYAGPIDQRDRFPGSDRPSLEALRIQPLVGRDRYVVPHMATWRTRDGVRLWSGGKGDGGARRRELEAFLRNSPHPDVAVAATEYLK